MAAPLRAECHIGPHSLVQSLLIVVAVVVVVVQLSCSLVVRCASIVAVVNQ